MHGQTNINNFNVGNIGKTYNTRHTIFTKHTIPDTQYLQNIQYQTHHIYKTSQTTQYTAQFFLNCCSVHVATIIV